MTPLLESMWILHLRCHAKPIWGFVIYFFDLYRIKETVDLSCCVAQSRREILQSHFPESVWIRKICPLFFIILIGSEGRNQSKTAVFEAF